jgi:hypothetical protein
MWLLCLFAAEWKKPAQAGLTEHSSHWARKIFFQSEIERRANGQISGEIVQSWWL